jgi:hypothetical protein
MLNGIEAKYRERQRYPEQLDTDDVGDQKRGDKDHRQPYIQPLRCGERMRLVVCVPIPCPFHLCDGYVLHERLPLILKKQ